MASDAVYYQEDWRETYQGAAKEMRSSANGNS